MIGTPLASDMMVRRVHTVSATDRVINAVRMLLKKKVSGAPVVDENNRVVGMLSEKDCIQALMRAVRDQLPPSLVGDVMSKEVVTVSPDSPLLTVAHMFLVKNVRRLPVVDHDGNLLGQISRSDLLKTATRVWDEAPTRDAAVLYLSAFERNAPNSVRSFTRRTPPNAPRRSSTPGASRRTRGPTTVE